MKPCVNGVDENGGTVCLDECNGYMSENVNDGFKYRYYVTG